MKRNVRWGLLCCYLAIPISGLVMRCVLRDREGRFHARQSTVLGCLYVGLVLGLSLLDAFGGAVIKWVGAFVAAATPIVSVFTALLWCSAVWSLAHGRPGRMPLIGHWVE